MEITKKAVTTISAIALAGTLGFCGALGANTQANAAETNSTEVTLQVTDDLSQISWSAPTKISLAVAGDGTLICPDDDVLKIQNENVLPIHLTKIKVEPTSPWTIVQDATNYDGKSNDVTSFQINFPVGAKNLSVNASDALEGLDVSTWSDLNLAYEGYETGEDETLADNVVFNLTGDTARITQDLTSEKGLSTITWTIASGLAA